MLPSEPGTAYVLKVYPRFSETFIVSEILAREAAGDRIEIFSLRPTTDSRFHPELARVQAPVTYIDRPIKTSALWGCIQTAVAAGLTPNQVRRIRKARVRRPVTASTEPP